MVPQKSTAVVFLMWLPYGIDYLERFADSYRDHAAGYPHKLVIVFNGISLVNDYASFRRFADSRFSDYDALEMDKGQDIEAYFFAASKRTEDHILFLNTFSEFKGSNWLRIYANAFQDGVGVVSATGSYQSLLSTTMKENSWKWQKGSSIKVNIRKYKLLLKTTLYRRFLLKSYPNPHLRTNAFMIGRDRFLQLKCPKLKTKFDAYLFENGRESLTRQIIKQGLRPVIVDRNGNVYDVQEWKQSRTFWSGEQENLLISDNQTLLYQNADKHYRKLLNENAWGHE